jgi:hypothetical protein
MSTSNTISFSVSLIGLVLLAGGLAAGYFFALQDLRDWVAARAHVPVPAEIMQVDLEKSKSKGAFATYPTTKVTARYRYQYNGRTYNSSRVSFHTSHENIGYSRHLYERLDKAWQNGEPVTAWVDPRDPQQSLLDREMRWIFFAFKSVITLLLITLGLKLAGIAFESRSTIIPTHGGRIRSGSLFEIAMSWIGALFLNTVAAMALRGFLFGNPQFNLFPGLVGLVFLAMGLLFLLYAALISLHWLRFGRLTLNIQPSPATTGGTLRGDLELREHFPAGTICHVVLSCIHSVTTRKRGSEHSKTSERTVWQQKVPVTLSPGKQGTRLDFRVAIPTGLPVSGEPSRDYHYWKLNISAEVPGIDLHHGFKIPVTAGPDNGEIILDEKMLTEPENKNALEIPAHFVRISEVNSATVLYYPPRQKFQGILAVVFGAVFADPLRHYLSSNKIYDTDVSLLKFLIYNPDVLLAVVLVLPLGLHWLTNSLRIEASSRGLVSKRRILGMPFIQRASAHEIIRIRRLRFRRKDVHGRTRARYRLVALLDDGRSITVGKHIPRKDLARHLRRLLRKALNLQPLKKAEPN